MLVKKRILKDGLKLLKENITDKGEQQNQSAIMLITVEKYGR